MSSRFYLGAYWGSRPESVPQCSQRLAGCLPRLAAADPLLATWFRPGNSKAEALRSKIDTSQESLQELIYKGRNKKFAALGFMVAMWNGKELSASLSVTCGSDAVVSPNAVILKYPEPAEGSHNLYNPETAKKIFFAVVEEWDPDWAFFGTGHMREIQHQKTRKPIAGWLSYIRGGYALARDPGANVDVLTLSEGTLLIAGPEPLQTTDEQVTEAADMLSRVRVHS